jgi:hypothetical protein
VYLLAAPVGGGTATLLAKQASDDTDAWESSVAAARMILAEGSLSVGLAGNAELGGCPIVAPQAEAIRPEDGIRL